MKLLKRLVSGFLAGVTALTAIMCGSVGASAAEKYSVDIKLVADLSANGLNSMQFNINGYTRDKYYKEHRSYSSNMSDKISYIKIDFGDYYCYFEDDGTSAESDKCGIYKAGQKEPSFECFGYAYEKSFLISTLSMDSAKKKDLLSFYNSISDIKTAELIIKPKGQSENKNKNISVSFSGDLKYVDDINNKSSSEKDGNSSGGGKSKELVISDKEIDSFAYSDRSDIGKVVLKDSVKTIGMYAFDSSSVTEVKMSDSVTGIEKNAFGKCKNLTTITLSKNITKIEETTFFGCENLKNIVIPNGVKEIGEKAFWGCESLETIIIPDSVKTIGKDAFEFCEGLKKVYIPDGIKEISADAFEFCDKLTICGSSGSYAEKYASKNAIPFKVEAPPASSSATTSSTVSAPKTVKAVKSAAGKAKISWSKVNGADGYVVYMADKKDGKYSKIKTVTKNSTVSLTKSKLTTGKTYYFKVRSYKTVDGKKVYSKYSSVKSVKV